MRDTGAGTDSAENRPPLLRRAFNRASRFLWPRHNKLKRLALTAVIGFSAVIVSGHLPKVRHEYNQWANQNTPLPERDLITYESGSWSPFRNMAYKVAISGDYIMETGRVPVYAPLSASYFKIGNIKADWQDDDDSLNRALDKTFEDAADVIEKAPYIQALIRKAEWDASDQRIWDGIMCTLIDPLHSVPGLSTDDYRTESKLWQWPGAARALNDISKDMINGTRTSEYDCEAMSLIKLALLERLSHRFLPEKHRPQYFYASGYFAGDPDDIDTDVGHAFIVSVSPRTQKVTAVIEGTADGQAMYQPVLNDCPFRDFVNGAPILVRDGAVYAMNIYDERVPKLFEAYPGKLRLHPRTGSRMALG